MSPTDSITVYLPVSARAAPGIWKCGVQSASKASINFFCTPRFLFTGGYNWELNMENRVRFYCVTHTLTEGVPKFKSSSLDPQPRPLDPILHFTKLVGLPLMLKLRTKFEVCSFSLFRNTEGLPESKRTPRHPRHHMTSATSPLPNFALF